MSKPLLVLDQHFRTVDELFDPQTYQKLKELCEIAGGESRPMGKDRLTALIKDADFLVAARPALSEADLVGTTRLKAVVEVSGAFHGELDYEACFARKVEVLSCAPGFRFAVAEMGLAMLLGASRGLVAEHEAFRLGREQWLEERPVTDFTLYQQRIGFVGYGNIARELHHLLRPFEPEIFAFDPWLSAFPADVTALSLDDLCKTCRALIVTAVPAEDNHGLISKELIDHMLPGAALVLLSRAHVVDFDAALKAAALGKITFATDVFPTEPVGKDDSMRGTQQVVFSPHRAAAVKGGRQAIGRFILHDVEAILEGRPQRKLLAADQNRLKGLIQAQEQIEKTGRLSNT